MSETNTSRFANLDGVRALAASAVIVSHIALYKKTVGTNVASGRNIDELGGIGVTFFFVLSGFLITSLLLKEKEINHSISYKYFYLRRILRIWPLYFLVLFTGYFIFSKPNTQGAFWYSLFLLPNIAFIKQLLPTVIDPIWSIGIEEQYYLFQPHLFRLKKIKKTFLFTFLLLAFFLAIKIVLPFLSRFDFNLTGQIRDWFYFSRFDNMLIGSLTAMLLYNDTQKKFINFFSLKIIYNKTIQLIMYILFLLYVFFIFYFQLHPIHQILAVFAALIILNLVNSKTSIVSLENVVLNFLGKISYGLYLLHMFPLLAILYFSKKYFLGYDPVLVNVGIYLLTFISSVLLASLSYFYYEKYFLNLKSKFSKLKVD